MRHPPPLLLKLEEDDQHVTLLASATGLSHSIHLWPFGGLVWVLGCLCGPLGHRLCLYLNVSMAETSKAGTFLALPWFLGAPQKCLSELGIVAYACEGRAGRSETQGHPQLHSEFRLAWAI